MALGGGDAYGLELAGRDLPDQAGNIAKETVHMAGDHVGDGGRRAFVGNVRELDLGMLIEQLHRQVRHAAGARRSHGQRCAGLARRGHKFRTGAVGCLGVHHQHFHIADHQRDRRQIGGGLVAELGVERGVDGDRAHAGQPERAGVGRCARDEVGSDGSIGSGLVLYHDSVAQFLAQLLGQGARHKVDRASWGEGHHDACHLRLGRRQARPSRGSDGGAPENDAAGGVRIFHECLLY
ncbi:hypothetical protein D3C78_1274870 [compost metagenome]